MARFNDFDPKNLSARIQPHLLEARRLRDFLDLVIDPADPKPVIADFQPWQGNAATARQDIVDAMANVTTFYDQASYGTLNVPVDVTTYVALLNNADYYHRANGAAGYPNIDNAVLGQLMAECAQGAVDQGFNLDDYEVLVASIFLPGLGVRAWGGWRSSNFAYDDGAGTVINVTTINPLALIAQRHDANWGRTAHEFAHGLLDGGLVLGEDVYASDLIDSSEATAAAFTMMGNHDSHPLFSAFNMKQLGWYSAANVVVRDSSRNPFSETFDIVAHDPHHRRRRQSATTATRVSRAGGMGAEHCGYPRRRFRPQYQALGTGLGN